MAEVGICIWCKAKYKERTSWCKACNRGITAPHAHKGICDNCGKSTPAPYPGKPASQSKAKTTGKSAKKK